ncbi:MAG: hypothetical protein WB507_04810 [Solirubrobacterales bacterium]
MARRLIVLVSMIFGVALLTAQLAQANTGEIIEKQNEPPSAKDGWQAANCTKETPQCSPETPGQVFTTAGGHPPIGFTQYIIKHSKVVENVIEPIEEPLEGRDVKTLRVDLPPGLTVNTQSTTEKCTLAEFLHQPSPGVFVPECKAATKTGEEQASLVTNEPNVEFPPGSSNIIENTGTRLPLIPGVFQVPVYNLAPNHGEPALFGFVIAGKEPIFLNTEVSWESDYHESFTIHIPAEAKGTGLQTLISRLISFGASTGNGTYLTLPTTCFNPEDAAYKHLYSTWYRAESFEEPNPSFPSGSEAFEATLPEGVEQQSCESVPFEPGLRVDAGTTNVDSPSPASVTTEVPFEVPSGGEHEIAQSQLRSAKVTLPSGMGLNPSGSNGLVACSDEQFGKGKRIESNSCPANSVIGTAEIETPPLPKGSLKGNIYIGEQKSSNPSSGEEFRTLVEAKSEQYGIVVRLIGNVSANPQTGQLTTTFNEQEVGPLVGNLPEGLPQVPFESVSLRFNGAKSVLTSPPTCATAETTSSLEPWSTPTSTKAPVGKFTLSSVPGGGTCPQTLAQRAFAPSYTAKTDSTKAGAYSPFRVDIGRPDGQQELKGVNVTLPKGLIGNLTGIPYCSETALSAAAGSTGKAQQASSSCPAESMIGTASTEAGTGSEPVKLAGKVFLAGPYKGAPLSLAVITPAVSGPFDLGTVVVRIALFVNPETAQINAVSDPIPDVFGGVKLDLRSIDVNVDRSKFMLNPTNCAAQATSGVLNGGGSNPTNAADFSSYSVSAPFQATECNKLAFKPKLFTRLYGPTKRAKNPRIRAILEAPSGNANLSRSALTLPHAIFLDQAHIKTVCTRPQLAAQQCPQSSIYGQAEAKTPLLSGKLQGPVYLVGVGRQLPDLVADLNGQVNIQVHGILGSQGGGIKTVFYPTPDVPVSKFILNMNGGKKSLLINSTNLCSKSLVSYMNLKGQNEKKVVNNRLPLRVENCKK